MTPHTCPVCNGNGLVPNGFYRQTSGTWSTSDSTPEKCRTCNGIGIVWEADNGDDWDSLLKMTFIVPKEDKP